MIPLLDLHSHYSIKQAYGSPSVLVNRAKELGSKYAALTDYGSISGSVEFAQACKESDIIPILGCTFSIKFHGKIIVLVRNLEGWRSLVKLVSLSYTKEFYDSVNEQPYLTIEKLKEFGKNLICIIGFPGDIMQKVVFGDKVVFHKTREEIMEAIESDPKNNLEGWYKNLSETFYKVYLGLSPNNTDYTNWLNEVVRDTKLPTVILTNSHYPSESDYTYFRLLTCSHLKTTKNRWEQVTEKQQPELLRFKENKWCIPEYSDLFKSFSMEEINNTEVMINEFEPFNILNSPQLPTFVTSNGESPQECLTKLCRDGWKKKLANTNKIDTEEKKQIYTDRVKLELKSIGEAGLASYFLIVADFIKFIYESGWRCNPGRGSVGGCIIAYLTNITTIDPIEYNLLYSRFYNDSRKGSMPDIDTDVPVAHREEIIEYIRNKYGKERVGHLATYAEMKGATAIKEVLRINDVCSFDIMNEITRQIPEEGKVADEMENTGEKSLLLFTLKYRPEKLNDWARWEENEVRGDYAEWFKQAIKMEGTIQGIGKHASAIIVYNEPLSNVCPMISDKSGDEPMVGFEMNASEKIGCVKIDVLGSQTIDKILEVNNILKERKQHYINLLNSI